MDGRMDGLFLLFLLCSCRHFGFWNDLLCPTDRLRRKQLSVASNNQAIQYYGGTIPVVTTTK